jgi:hypothetical protein
MNETGIIITGAVSIVSTSIGAIVAFILTERRDRRKEFNQAASEFKSTFIPVLRFLDYQYSPKRPPEIGIYKTLSNVFDRHEIAVIKFRPYLNRQECTGFNKVWDDYCDKKYNKRGKPHFIEYAEPETPGKKGCAQKIYLKKLNHLISFAKPK